MKLKTLKVKDLFSYSQFDLDFTEFRPGIILIEGIDSDNPDKSNGCVIGSTLIDCPRDYKKHYWGIPIKDLVGKEFQTYSFDLKSKKFVLRRAFNVRKTGKKKKVYKLKYKGDKRNSYGFHYDYIIATEDHRILLTSGKYVELGNLKKGDRIRSLYKKTPFDKYWHINCDPESGSSTGYMYEHKFILRELCGSKVSYHGHHKDRNKDNNSPDNLEYLSSVAHMRHHCTVHNPMHNPEVKKVWVHPKGFLKRNHSEWSKKQIIDTLKETNKSPEVKKKRSLGAKIHWDSVGRVNDKISKEVLMDLYIYKELSCVEIGKILKFSDVSIAKCLDHYKIPRRKHKNKRIKRVLNHIVESVEFFGYEDVYDMEVEDTHNFVANGIVIHNSGKSSIFEIINWCLFHDTLKGGLLKDQDSIIRRGAKFGEASITFEHGSDLIFVYKRRSFGKTSLKLMVNDIEQDVKTTTEAKRYLEEFLNIEFEVWKNSIVFGQNSANLFLHGSSKDRNDLVGNILNFDVLDGCLKMVREQLKGSNSSITSYKALCADAKDDLAEAAWYCGLKVCDEVLEQNREQLNKDKKELNISRELLKGCAEMQRMYERKEGLRRIIESVNESLEIEADQYKVMDNKTKEDIKELNGKLLKYSEAYRKVVVNFPKLKKALSHYVAEEESSQLLLKKTQGSKNQLIGERNALASKFDKINHSPKCPTCDQAIGTSVVAGIKRKIDTISANVIKIEGDEVLITDKIKELVAKVVDLNEKRDKYEDVIEVKESTEADVERLKNASATNYSSYRLRVVRHEQKLESYTKDFDAIDIDQKLIDRGETYAGFVETHEEKVSTQEILVTKLESALEEYNRLDEKIGILNKKIKLTEEKMKKYLEAEQVFGQQGVRNFMVQKVTPSIEQKINSHLVEVGKGNLTVALEWSDKFNINVENNGVVAPIHSFSGGEDKLLSIIFHLALSEVVLERGLRFHFQIMDESFDNLDLYNSNLLVELFHSWAQKQSKLVFLITHNSQVRDLIEAYSTGTITCIKKDGVSTLDYSN